MLKTRKPSHRQCPRLGGVALFVALGGTAMANDKVRAFVTGADVRNSSLTGKDVRDRSLTAADLAPGVLRAGPQGRRARPARKARRVRPARKVRRVPRGQRASGGAR